MYRHQTMGLGFRHLAKVIGFRHFEYFGKRSAVFLVPLLFIIGLAMTTAPVVADQLVDFSAAPQIDNGDAKTTPVTRIKLEELWRAGGDDDDYFFGVIGDCLRDEEGNVYLLDQQLCEVCVYSPTGQRLRTLSGPGEGPGEIDDPYDILFMPDGTLGIVHRPAGEIVRLNLDGTPCSSYRLTGENGEPLANVRLRQACISGENIVISANQRRRTNRLNDHERFLSLFSATGLEGRKLINNTTIGFDFEGRKFTEINNYFVSGSGWTTDTAGRIYIAPERNRYLIQIFNPDGTPLRVITREFTAPRRTDKEIAEVEAGLSMTINGEEIKFDAKIEQRHQTIRKLRVDRDGNLWVQHSRSTRDLPDGVFIRYDRFDPEGRLVDQVEILCDGDPEQDELYCLAGDTFILLRNIAEAREAFYAQFNTEETEEETDADEVEPLEIVCFKRR